MEDEITQLKNQVDNLQKKLDDFVQNYNKDNFSGLYIETKDYQHKGTRLSFYNLPTITQPQSTGETTGASDTALSNATTFTGNNGSTAYTVLDIVKHLKNLGLLKK